MPQSGEFVLLCWLLKHQIPVIEYGEGVDEYNGIPATKVNTGLMNGTDGVKGGETGRIFQTSKRSFRDDIYAFHLLKY